MVFNTVNFSPCGLIATTIIWMWFCLRLNSQRCPSHLDLHPLICSWGISVVFWCLWLIFYVSRKWSSFVSLIVPLCHLVLVPEKFTANIQGQPTRYHEKKEREAERSRIEESTVCWNLQKCGLWWQQEQLDPTVWVKKSVAFMVGEKWLHHS